MPPIRDATTGTPAARASRMRSEQVSGQIEARPARRSRQTLRESVRVARRHGNGYARRSPTSPTRPIPIVAVIGRVGAEQIERGGAGRQPLEGLDQQVRRFRHHRASGKADAQPIRRLTRSPRAEWLDPCGDVTIRSAGTPNWMKRCRMCSDGASRVRLPDLHVRNAPLCLAQSAASAGQRLTETTSAAGRRRDTPGGSRAATDRITAAPAYPAAPIPAASPTQFAQPGGSGPRHTRYDTSSSCPRWHMSQ